MPRQIEEENRGVGRPVYKIALNAEEVEALREAMKEDPLDPDTIRTIRQCRGESQAQFAEHVEVTERTIQDYEAGRRNCSRSARNLVCRMGMRIKVDDFVPEEDAQASA